MAERHRNVLKRFGLTLGLALGVVPAPASGAEAPGTRDAPGGGGSRTSGAAATTTERTVLTLIHVVDAPGEFDAAALTRTLADGAEDLELDVSPSFLPGPVAPERGDQQHVGARLRRLPDGRFVVTVELRRAGEAVVEARTATTPRERIPVATMRLLRSLVRGEPASRRRPRPCPADPEMSPPRSAGSTVLAVNGLLLGGFVGYALQRASGSTDDRLTYPLVALGAGIGLGSSALVSEEWDVTTGAAWYLSAASFWPIAGSAAILRGDDFEPQEDRALIALASAAGAIGVATTALALGGEVSNGDALLTHSGAAFGAVIGSMTENLAEGGSDLRPNVGLGVGALAGLVVSGGAALLVDTSSSKVLTMDVGILLGGLGAAAIASPLIIDDPASGESSVWAGAVIGGVVLGVVGGVWYAGGLGREGSRPRAAGSRWRVEPGPVAGPLTPVGVPAPAGAASPVGLSLRGRW